LKNNTVEMKKHEEENEAIGDWNCHYDSLIRHSSIYPADSWKQKTSSQLNSGGLRRVLVMLLGVCLSTRAAVKA
jgi:hypothetical protein